jgi:O-antigen ligase
VTARAWSSWSAALWWTVALAALLALTAADVFLAYATKPAFAVVAVAGIAIFVGVLQRPVIGIYGAMLAIPLEFYSVRVGGDAGLSPTEGLLLLSAMAIGLRSLLGRDEEHIAPAHAAFGGFILIMVAGFAYAQETLPIAKVVFQWTVILICAVHVSSRDRGTVANVLVCIAVAGGVVGLIAMLSSGNQELHAGGSFATGRAQASFAQPKVLAFFLAMALPLALMLAGRGQLAWRVFMLAMAAFAVGGLLLTLSRQGVIGMILAVLVLLAWPPFRRKLFALLGIVVVVAALNMGTLINQRDAAVVGSRLSLVGERLQTLTEGRQVKQDQRVKIWSAAPAMIADRPFFGVGAANYSVWSPRYNVLEAPGVAFDHAHNVFLTVAIEEGIVGLAVFLLFLAAVVAAGVGALRSGGPDKPLALAIVAALVAELGMGIVDYPPRTNAIMGTIMLLIGALVAYDRLGAADRERAAS